MNVNTMVIATPPSTAGTSGFIQKMKERHHEIKRRLIAGDNQRTIAHAIGLTESRLSIIINSPAFQQELLAHRAVADRNAADMAGRITELAPDAMRVKGS